MKYDRAQSVKRIDKDGNEYTAVDLYYKGELVSEWNRDTCPEHIARNPYNYGFGLQTESPIESRGVSREIFADRTIMNYRGFMYGILGKMGVRGNKANKLINPLAHQMKAVIMSKQRCEMVD